MQHSVAELSWPNDCHLKWGSSRTPEGEKQFAPSYANQGESNLLTLKTDGGQWIQMSARGGLHDGHTQHTDKTVTDIKLCITPGFVTCRGQPSDALIDTSILQIPRKL